MVKVIRNFKRLIRMGLTIGRKVVCKRMQHCWQTTPNIVGSCCVRLCVAKSLTGFKLCATTRNNIQQLVRVYKRTQHVTSNKVGSCWPTMLRPFARGLTKPKSFKVARPSIFIGTPSIFESLILKQIDLYCKTIMTHGLHLD